MPRFNDSLGTTLKGVAGTDPEVQSIQQIKFKRRWWLWTLQLPLLVWEVCIIDATEHYEFASGEMFGLAPRRPSRCPVCLKWRVQRGRGALEHKNKHKTTTWSVSSAHWHSEQSCLHQSWSRTDSLLHIRCELVNLWGSARSNEITQQVFLLVPSSWMWGFAAFLCYLWKKTMRDWALGCLLDGRCNLKMSLLVLGNWVFFWHCFHSLIS